MINYRKLKRQIHRQCFGGHVTGYVFEVTSQQIDDSDWQMFSIDVEGSKRRLLKSLKGIIYDNSMDHWRKEFLL